MCVQDIRDIVMDHVLETMVTDLKHTVLLMCEDVPDFRPAPSEATTDTAHDALPAFLEGLEGGYELYTKIGDGDSIPRSDSIFLRMPVSKREVENEKKAAKKAIKKQIKKFKKTHGDKSGLTADFYVLSDENLRRHLSSIPFDDYEAQGYVTTAPLASGDTRPPEQLLVAIDCEMCKTTKGVELTRVTLVDAKENVLLDEYVRPKNPIVDYCTQYSGITQDIMESCTNRLEEIQQRFLSLVPADAILVGHSIENDLQALRIVHKRIIDTTVLYPHPRGPPFRSALRFLTSTFLHRAIQTGSDGHCSVEDAVATLQLVQLKLKRGPNFPSIEQEFTQKKIIHELALAKKSVLIVDSLKACRALTAGAACILPSESPEQVVHNVVHQLTTGFPPHFTWARVRGASRTEIAAFVKAIRTHVAASHSCLLVVASGATTALRELHKVRTTRSDPRSSLMWDKTQQLQLDVLASRTQEGIVHVFLP
jgi:RNA exonuclease 1